jgi:hypothetical protein
MSIRASIHRLGAAVVLVGALTLMCAIAAGANAPPSLRISAPSTTLAQWDTMSGVLATPRMLDGAIAGKSPVTWTSVPAGVVLITKLDAPAHSVAIAGLMPGSVKIVASWRTFSGAVHLVNGLPTIDTVTLRDSITLTVTAPTVTITPFNVVTNGVASFDLTLSVFCLYAVATDKHGGIYSGMRATWATNDTTLLRQLNHAPCSDTTVSPALLAVPLPRPPQ